MLDSVSNKQIENLKFLLIHEGLTQKDFSQKIHINEVTVSKWMRGKNNIGAKSAKKINSVFPEYSIDFLMGNSDFPNNSYQFEFEYINEKQRFQNMEKSVVILAHLGGGFDFSSPWADKKQDNGIDPVDMFLKQNMRISHGENSVTLSAGEWKAFIDEVSGYIEMRFNQMIERGCW